jgi:hypothetical protein
MRSTGIRDDASLIDGSAAHARIWPVRLHETLNMIAPTASLIAAIRQPLPKQPHLNAASKIASLAPKRARSFYIRFAKITLPNLLALSLRQNQGYNVFRYQGFSSSTLQSGLASNLY